MNVQSSLAASELAGPGREFHALSVPTGLFSDEQEVAKRAPYVEDPASSSQALLDGAQPAFEREAVLDPGFEVVCIAALWIAAAVVGPIVNGRWVVWDELAVDEATLRAPQDRETIDVKQALPAGLTAKR